MEEVARKHDLEPYIHFNSEVILAEWVPTMQGYEVVIQKNPCRTRRTLFANILVSAHGLFPVPKLPSIPGLDTFSGAVMHTAEWDNSVALQGKRVAVLGNGPSGLVFMIYLLTRYMIHFYRTQLVTKISQIQDIEVVQFIRTSNWIFPAVRNYLFLRSTH